MHLSPSHIIPQMLMLILLPILHFMSFFTSFFICNNLGLTIHFLAFKNPLLDVDLVNLVAIYTFLYQVTAILDNILELHTYMLENCF